MSSIKKDETTLDLLTLIATGLLKNLVKYRSHICPCETSVPFFALVNFSLNNEIHKNFLKII
jgi:hypothetical protein